MGEQTGTRLNGRSAACKSPSELIRKKQLPRPRRIKKSLNLHFRPSPILVAVSLIIILIISVLVWAWYLEWLRISSDGLMNDIPYQWDEGQWSLILILVTIPISIWFLELKFNTSRRGDEEAPLAEERRQEEAYQARRLAEETRWEEDERQRIAYKDDIDLPTRYLLVSWLRRRRSIKHVDVDESREPDSSDQ